MEFRLQPQGFMEYFAKQQSSGNYITKLAGDVEYIDCISAEW